MKTTVVCGLLGAGKTTFIRNFVERGGGKTVVLVNDFGAAGIDGEIFSAGGIETIELPSGCVCCTLKFDLITTIQKIMREFSPEHLVIEPSGVASASGVLEAVSSAGIGSATVIGIIDATEFTELYDSGMYGSFFEDQISNADIILVNKTDLAREEQIVEAMDRIEAINPRAIQFRTANALVPVPLVDPLFAGERAAGKGMKSRAVGGPQEHFHFDTLSFRLNGETTLAHFSDFFADLAQGRYGDVARAKALIRSEEGPYRFDSVFGRVDRIRFEQDIKESRLVVIGEGLDKQAIEKTLPRGLCEGTQKTASRGSKTCTDDYGSDSNL